MFRKSAEPLFFDKHPEFLETSTTASAKDRLNLRHVGIIQENADILRGRSVIDIASHDGRWSYAALEAGASHVLGIEGRRRLIDHTVKTFADKGVPESQYAFVRGDVHRKLHNPEVTGQVVFCLGFLYHTARYVELMSGIHSTGAEYVIVDTRVLQNVEGPLVEMRNERTAGEAQAMRDRYAVDRHVITATPSEDAVLLMLEAVGYELDHRTDWQAITGKHSKARAMKQYKIGKRVTFRVKRVS